MGVNYTTGYPAISESKFISIYDLSLLKRNSLLYLVRSSNPYSFSISLYLGKGKLGTTPYTKMYMQFPREKNHFRTDQTPIEIIYLDINEWMALYENLCLTVSLTTLRKNQFFSLSFLFNVDYLIYFLIQFNPFAQLEFGSHAHCDPKWTPMSPTRQGLFEPKLFFSCWLS